MKPRPVTWTKALLLLPSIILLTWLLWPLGDRRFAIHADAAREREKEVYLASLKKSISRGKKPNIIILLADDLGKTDISLYGGKAVATPNIDSIGQQGVTYADASCSAPVCSPSRASLLTGRYQQRYGFYRQPMNRYPRNRLEMLISKYMIFTGDWRPDYVTAVPRSSDIRRQGLPESEITLAELLGARGYRSAITGKWHLGHERPFVPGNRGFDEQYGFYEAFSLYAPEDAPGLVNHRHDYFASRHIWSRGREGTCAIRRNNKVIEEKVYLTFRIAEEAECFIRKNRNRPFFLYVPFSAPHTPFQAPATHVEKFRHVKDKNRRVYYAMIAALDDAVGRILKTLREEKLENNTILFFASDNGGATYTGATDNAPLKGGKFSNFEGGVNVPMMMRYPGRVPAGKVEKKPVALMDIFTTVAIQAGIELPEERTFDGINLLSTKEMGKKTPRELFWKSGYNKAIRRGDFKLLVNERSCQVLLYNLKLDKEEEHNLSRAMPETVTKLLEILDAWERELMPPLWPGFMNYRFTIDGEEHYFSI